MSDGPSEIQGATPNVPPQLVGFICCLLPLFNCPNGRLRWWYVWGGNHFGSSETRNLAQKMHGKQRWQNLVWKELGILGILKNGHKRWAKRLNFCWIHAFWCFPEYVSYWFISSSNLVRLPLKLKLKPLESNNLKRNKRILFQASLFSAITV